MCQYLARKMMGVIFSIKNQTNPHPFCWVVYHGWISLSKEKKCLRSSSLVVSPEIRRFQFVIYLIDLSDLLSFYAVTSFQHVRLLYFYEAGFQLVPLFQCMCYYPKYQILGQSFSLFQTVSLL